MNYILEAAIYTELAIVCGFLIDLAVKVHLKTCFDTFDSRHSVHVRNSRGEHLLFRNIFGIKNNDTRLI